MFKWMLLQIFHSLNIREGSFKQKNCYKDEG